MSKLCEKKWDLRAYAQGLSFSTLRHFQITILEIIIIIKMAERNEDIYMQYDAVLYDLK